MTCAPIRWPARRRAPATSTATPRSPPRLVASTKNQVEHRVVIDVVHDTLLPWCSFLDWEPDPSIVTVANVQHLGTRIEGCCRAPPPNVLELVRALSPTPAVGGHPRHEALALIAAVEGVDRGRYAGAVGGSTPPATARGPSRCAAPSCPPTARQARLTAGGGIVADSDPLAELAETQAKFQAMLSALIRPESTELSRSARDDGGVQRGVDRARSRPGRCATRVTVGPGACEPGRRARPTSSPSPRRCRGRRARATRSVPCGVPNSCSKRSAASAVACGRNEKMPPPSLSTTTIRRSAPRCRARSARRRRGRTRCRRRTATVGAPVRSATPSAVDITPSMPLAPRLACAAARAAAEPLEVAHRHRRGDDDLGRRRAVAGDEAGDGRLAQRRLGTEEPRRWRPSASGRPRRSTGRATARRRRRAARRRAPQHAGVELGGDDAGRGRSTPGPPTCTTVAPDAGDPLGEHLRRRRAAEPHDDLGRARRRTARGAAGRRTRATAPGTSRRRDTASASSGQPVAVDERRDDVARRGCRRRRARDRGRGAATSTTRVGRAPRRRRRRGAGDPPARRQRPGRRRRAARGTAG